MEEEDIRVKEAFRRIILGVARIARGEFHLARSELAEAWKTSARYLTIALFVAGSSMIAGIYGLVFLWVGLGELLEGRYWLSAIILFSLFSVMAGIGAAIVARGLKDASFNFEKTRESLKEERELIVDMIESANKESRKAS